MREFVSAKGSARMPAGAARPVLVIEGCGGSGRTALLAHLSERQSSLVPHVLLDPRLHDGDAPFGPVSAMLLASAFGLSRRLPGAGRLTFPRLLVAHLAMAQTGIALTNPRQARADMNAALTRYRDRHEAIQLVGNLVRGLAPVVAPLPGSNEVADFLAKLLVRSLHSSPLTLRLSFREGSDWFAHLDEGIKQDPTDGLISLALKARADNQGVQREVDEVLTAAFLADIRASLARNPRRGWNCELLVDNADHPLAVALLTTLAGVRKRQANRGLSADLLTVVAASDGGLMARALPTPADEEVLPESALPALTGADLGQHVSWLRLRLDPLSEDDLAAMAGDTLHFVPVRRQDAIRQAYALTRGHPGATRLVLDALTDAPALVDNLPALLRRPVDTAKGSVPLEEAILVEVLGDLGADPAVRRDLVTLSAARNRDEADRAVARGEMTTVSRQDRATVLSPILWLPPAADGVATLLPAARYLLLRELAGRDNDDPLSWSPVFGRLCRYAAEGRPASDGRGSYERDTGERDEFAGELHHRLALGDVATVADNLAERLRHRDVTEWLTLLETVTATPDPRLPVDGAAEQIHRVVKESELADPASVGIAHLVCALRLIGDPRVTSGPACRGLHLLAAHSYDSIAEHSLNGLTVLLDRAERHRQLAAACM